MSFHSNKAVKRGVINFKEYGVRWAAYSVALIVIGIFFTSFSTGEWIDLWLLVKSPGAADPHSFVAAAMDINSTGWVTDKTRWILNTWPPGFILLEAGLLRFFGDEAPIPLMLLAISASIFAIILTEMSYMLGGVFGRWTWFIPIALFSFPEARMSLLSPIGLLLGEWLAIGSFLLAVLMLLHRSYKSALFAGLLFSISAYSRSQFEMFLSVILMVVVGLTVFMVFRLRQKYLGHWKEAKLLLVAILFAQLLMLPWRLYHLHDGKDLRWVYTGPQIVQLSLSSDNALREMGAEWLVLGGINVACHLSPPDCGKSDFDTYSRIFLEHPISWMAQKVELLPSYWFAPLGSLTSPVGSTNWFAIAQESALLIFLLFHFGALWAIRKSNYMVTFCGVSLGLLGGYCAIIIFSQFEVRYFFFIKIYGMFACILMLPVLLEIFPKLQNWRLNK